MMLRTKCPQCKRKLEEGQKIHPECVADFAAARAAKADRSKQKVLKAAQKLDREINKERKESLKTLAQLTKEAQQYFNAFIRERDRLACHPCISSGRALDWSGNAVDAGHYRSTGAAKHLRFNEDNCHAQSKHDNQYKAGNVVDYRIRLIERIGLARVESLECDNTVKKWTREELVAIKAKYKAKLKALKSA